MTFRHCLSVINKFLQCSRRFLWLLFSQCLQDKCTQVAGALTYTTSLALVPLLAVLFVIFSAFPFFSGLLQRAQAFAFDIFAPGIRESIQQNILIFVERAAGLTSISVIALFLSALLTLNTVDITLNRIWDVRRGKSTMIRLFVYLMILILGPVLISLSLIMTTYLLSLPYISTVVEQPLLAGVFLYFAPIIVSLFLFAFIYYWVPNTTVRWRHALTGGVVAAALFELAKHIFALYITWFPTYELLYGALATIPLMLIWIYVSWLIVLIGAEVAYSLGVWHRQQTDESG